MRAQKSRPPGQFSGIPAIFSDKRPGPVLFLIPGAVFLAVLGGLGYGADSDAWLMVHTALKLRMGEAYDPARSFGNPLYEYFLCLLPHPDAYRVSNGLNSVLALFFLYRLGAAFPGLAPGRLLFLQVCWLVFPPFYEAASSTMDYLPAWVCWLEAHIRLQRGRHLPAALFLLAATGFRPETGALAALAYGLPPGRNRRVYALPLLAALVWCFLQSGKNPLPAGSFSQWLDFYLGRIRFWAGQTGLWLLPIFFSVRQGLKVLDFGRPECRPVLTFGLFFLLLPFEWAYGFPALLLLSGKAAAHFSGARITALPVLLTLAGFFPWGYPGNPVVPGWPGPVQQRMRMHSEFLAAGTAAPPFPALILNGATWIPIDPTCWEAEIPGRLFRKKGSLLSVGERLSPAETDSLRQAGFRIYSGFRDFQRDTESSGN